MRELYQPGGLEEDYRRHSVARLDLKRGLQLW